MKKDTAIHFEDVTFYYDGAAALKNASFNIADGEFAAIIGPNGGGKTTMLKLMLGLLEAQRGKVRVLGESPVSARTRVGYMPQNPHLDHAFPVTVADVVLLARLGMGSRFGPFRRADRRAARSALESVDLADLSDRPFSALSAGQQQRALIARALAGEPELLLLDEPATNLDPSIQNELYEMLHRLNEHLTVVVVSHDVGFVSRYVEKVVCVNRTVVLHQASDVEGEIASKLYGSMPVRIVDHSHHTP